MATIQLKRNVNGEYIPRRYEMSSEADFETVKNAVKAAGGKFESKFEDKSWLISGDILRALKEAGYTITEKSPFYQDTFVEQSIKDGGDTSTCNVGFRMMQADFQRMAGNLTVTFDTSTELVESEIERLNEMAVTSLAGIGQTPKASYDRYYGVRALARKAANDHAAKVEARTLELLKATKRSKEEYVAVLKQVIAEFGIRG